MSEKNGKDEKRTVTYTRPGLRSGMRASLRASRRPEPIVFDWETVRPVAKGEVMIVFMAGVVLAFFATLVSYSKGYVLLYGDAVAHLAIARRILDARWPGLGQLGGVWLPLPHLLMMPFVQNIHWWQSGLSAAPMCIVSYAASVAGVWRLARRMMPVRWALVAATFYALNANLLFLASTAMTETLFLALLVWTVVAAVETTVALRAGNVLRARAWLLVAGALILGQVFTRYDGWIVGAAVWCCLGWELWRSDAAVRRRVMPMFGVFTVLCVTGPVLWFWYNQHFMHDWLDFMRGPYSAKAIERKTAPPGQHYRGWKNPGWALLFYLRTAQVDASAWETGWVVMMAALGGLWVSLRRGRPWKPTSEIPDVGQPRKVAASAGYSAAPERVMAESLSASKLVWLLWVPLPFYVYSVAYGSVPIFIPQLWPHSYYNARYGMEMLPALAIYAVLLAERGDAWMRGRTEAWAKIGVRLAQSGAMLLCVANAIAMMYFVPLVLKEGMVNAKTRVPFEKAIATELMQVPLNVPVMMYTSAHVGAVQVAGRTLKSMVSEMDSDSWEKALKDPAGNAGVVVAIAGDPVDAAVKAHPEGLMELEVICTSGQPCARIYQSTVVTPKP